ncbi:GGDEF domain-containing protein [Pseudodesulfovibrio sediminis]|nr:GGDEF domain-containing protein [Pseudodesulfovibrio sediminis]
MTENGACIDVEQITNIIKTNGVQNDADWMAIILFVRNLLTKLTVYTEEKKAEIQREICTQLAQKDFSDTHLETIIAMLDMYIMQNIGSLELEEALAQEKRSAALLLNEMNDIVASMQGSHERHQSKLDSFKDETVSVIEECNKKSLIISKVREMFQGLIVEFQEEARALNEKAQQFEQTANFDPLLTDLHNRRALEIFLQAAAMEYENTGEPLSMMMIDVDHFKTVNDTCGHQAGDDVLRALAHIITAHAIQYSGFAARYGGEELVIIMKGLTQEMASIKAEAIRADVENYDFRIRTDGQLAEHSLRFTVSIGVAEMHKGWNAGSLVGAADKAMYQAKNTGRNQVRRAPEIS